MESLTTGPELENSQGHSRPGRASSKSGHVRCALILLQKSAILVVGLALRPLEADSDYSFSHWTLVGV
jgi:hypothetical protein